MGELAPFVVLGDLFHSAPLIFLCLVGKPEVLEPLPPPHGWVHRVGVAQGSASGRGSSPPGDTAAWGTI